MKSRHAPHRPSALHLFSSVFFTPIEERCPACGGALIERRLKKHCTHCGILCETCCDGGKT